MFHLEDRQRERIIYYPAFYSIQALSEAHLHLGGQSALFSLLIQMLISSQNILTITPRNIGKPNSWTSCR